MLEHAAERLKVKRKCCHWTHGTTVILAAVVGDITIAKVDVPSVVAVALSNTPVAAICRYCEG